MRYLVDSDWLVDALVGIPAAVQMLDRLLDQGNEVNVSIISVGDFYEGTYDAPDPQEHLRHFRVFLSRIPVVPLSDPIMEVFARTRSDLRRQGQLIPDFDIAIAATALHHDLVLITRNLRHFGRISDLRLHQLD
jgi:predicted nucleic acid-binding protein